VEGLSEVIYIKSILAGIAAVLAVLVIIVLVTFVFPLMLIARTGSGGIGAVSSGIPVFALLFIPLAFAGGFYWEFRRASRRRA
jgi:hypothetical protein